MATLFTGWAISAQQFSYITMSEYCVGSNIIFFKNYEYFMLDLEIFWVRNLVTWPHSNLKVVHLLKLWSVSGSFLSSLHPSWYKFLQYFPAALGGSLWESISKPTTYLILYKLVQDNKRPAEDKMLRPHSATSVSNWSNLKPNQFETEGTQNWSGISFHFLVTSVTYFRTNQNICHSYVRELVVVLNDDHPQFRCSSACIVAYYWIVEHYIIVYWLLH